ncbi:hypothetical protein Q3G72_035216 [Acer saccharum]|nr:hypothetical protein Q3G72_035216 [Acer saccharum]
MERLFTKLCMLIVVALALQMHGNKGCLENERIALLAIKPFIINATVPYYANVESWVDDHNRIVESWVDDRVSDCCDWYRVECSTTTSRVMNLSLSSLLYHSTTILNFSLFQPFEQLQILDLSGNYFKGLVDSRGICNLKNLIELDLSRNNFEGHLPPCVVNNLTILRAVDLLFNQLTGNIPSLNLMQSLEYLSLMDNNFSMLQVQETENSPQPPKSQLKVLYLSNCNLHVIPSFLMYQHSLEFIDLSHNKLVGMFPTWLLQNNTRLQGMHLTDNSLSGILQLPNSTHDLLDLRISSNNLSGQLPMNIGVVLPRLRLLDLSQNSLEGYIPWSMGEMKSLTSLDLSSNNFSGELPKPFVSGCPSLEYLILSNNNFHGEIFPRFMNMTQLRLLFLDNNRFGGKIQDGLQKARFLLVLDLSSNSLSGQIPDWIGNFSKLNTLVLSNNHLEGGVPVQLSNLKGLEYLDISENRLSGSMASSFNLSSYVERIYMQKNALSGSIPNTFFRSPNLVVLDLRDNNFSGSIPNKIDDKLTNLYFLLLGGNRLEGNIPHELCNFKHLSILDLLHNRLSGPVPSCFTNVPFWAVEDGYHEYEFFGVTFWPISDDGYNLFITSYNLTLSFQTFIERMLEPWQELQVGFVTKNRNESYKGSILNYMMGLDLSSNELTGDIPIDIGNLQQIKAMNLSHNFLSGSIPESFSNLTNIESLDLSHNKLSGRIPPQLTQLNSLAIFNVSINSLSGPVPDKGQFGTFDESNYGGNPGLCGSQIKSCGSSEPTTPPATPSHEDESAIDMVSFYWSLFAAYVTTIMGFVLILWLNLDWRKRWFCFIDACIISSYCWILRNVFHMYDDI